MFICLFIIYIYIYIYILGEGGLEGEARFGVGGLDRTVLLTCNAWQIDAKEAYLGGFASICQAGNVISKLRAKQDLLVFC